MPKFKQLLIALFSLFTLSFIPACEPSSQFSLLSGEKQSLETYKGSWLVVNFWAEWCPPCLKEIPELNELEAHVNDVKVLGISYDKLDNEALKALKEKYAIGYGLISSEPMPYLPFPKPESLPASYLITPKGDFIGPMYGEVSMEKIIKLKAKIEASAQ